jgi:hypothetical protein
MATPDVFECTGLTSADPADESCRCLGCRANRAVRDAIASMRVVCAAVAENSRPHAGTNCQCGECVGALAAADAIRGADPTDSDQGRAKFFVFHCCGSCNDGSCGYGLEVCDTLDAARAFAAVWLRENATESPFAVIIRGEEVPT